MALFNRNKIYTTKSGQAGGLLLIILGIIATVAISKPILWPDGFGISEGKSVTTTVEKDKQRNVIKTVETTKLDPGKTLWDWLSLLGVPLTLAILGYWLQQKQQKRAEEVAKEQRDRDQKIANQQRNRDLEIANQQRERNEKIANQQRERDEKIANQQRERDEKIANQQRKRDEEIANQQRELAANEAKEEVLRVYFDRLSTLLVDKNLLAIAAKAKVNIKNPEAPQATPEEQKLLDSTMYVIRARTLSILRRFEKDKERKTSVIRFLIEAEIVSKLKLNLSSAILSSADLSYANLVRADLRFADLVRADLSSADLSYAKLSSAILSNANLHNAILIGADLGSVNLSSAELIGTNLSTGNLNRANLSTANLSSANLNRANLSGADLSGANLSGASLYGADLKDVKC